MNETLDPKYSIDKAISELRALDLDMIERFSRIMRLPSDVIDPLTRSDIEEFIRDWRYVIRTALLHIEVEKERIRNTNNQ